MKPFDPGNRLVVALDSLDGDEACDMARSLAGEVALLKVGMELLVADGPGIVRSILEQGHRVMLDVKLHDIPATVARATLRAATLGVHFVTVHASGGLDMLGAAVWAADEARRSGKDLRILATTVLPSLDQAALGQTGVAGRVDDLVEMRARLAQEAGCHGVVAAPGATAMLRTRCGDDFLLVTPGLHVDGTDHAGDNSGRATSPAEARRAGADLLVCGRAVRDADDPVAAARAIAADIAAASEPTELAR